MAKKKASKKAKSKKKQTVPSNALAAKIAFLTAECGLTTVEAAERGGGFKELPVGRGQAVRMNEASIKINKSDDVMITWHLIGIGEDNLNCSEYVNINLKADGKSMPYAKADVEAMELDWAEEIATAMQVLADNPDAEAVHIEAAEGLELLVDVWQKAGTEFKNTAITGLAEGSDTEHTMPEPDAADEPEADDITADDIKAMSDDDLEACAKAETDLKQAAMDDMSYDELREYLIDELT